MSSPTNEENYTFLRQSLSEFQDTYRDLSKGFGYDDPIDLILQSIEATERGLDYPHKIVDLGAGKGTFIRQLEIELRRLRIRDQVFVENVSKTDLRIDKQSPAAGKTLIDNDLLWQIPYTLADVNDWLKNQPRKSIDIINTSHLLEHLDHPIQAILDIVSKLKENGILFCTAEFLTIPVGENEILLALDMLKKSNYIVKHKKTNNGFAFIVINADNNKHVSTTS